MIIPFAKRPPSPSPSHDEAFMDSWAEMLRDLAEEAPFAAGLLRDVRGVEVDYGAGTLKLYPPSKLHDHMLGRPATRKVIERVVQFHIAAGMRLEVAPFDRSLLFGHQAP